jgi:hypothetical protein
MLRLRLRIVVRLLVGPLLVGVFAGFEFARFGAFAAVAAGYLTFVVAQVAIDRWTRLQARRAWKRLRALHQSRRGPGS